MINERLREERKRLGLSQKNMADLAKVSRQTYNEWEAGNTYPTAVQLSVLAEAGADAGYIVTGARSVMGLSPRQAALLDNHSHLTEEDQRALERTAFALARPEVKGKAA
jgi:transcriptional regulator with XRE-family HTH domain